MPADFLANFQFNFNLDQFLNLAGTSPFVAMWYLFLNGGWIAVVWAFLWGAMYLWLDFVQGRTASKKEWALLRISIPRTSEQTPKAVENLFAQLSGAHSPAVWTEKWILGHTQSSLSVEVVSLEGEVGFYIHCERKMRDLVEASIYAQYPDADIDLIDDYTKNVPQQYPNDEYDVWGMEMVPVKNDAYPLKTYRDFEDQVSGEFKDPLAVLLESFSRFGPGEQAWYQIVFVPISQPEARKKCEKLIDKIKGIEMVSKKTILDHIVDLPLNVLKMLVEGLAGAPPAVPVKKDTKTAFPKMMALSPGERDVLEAVERKASKILYSCKIRIVYVAKKEVMAKSRIAAPFVGAIKQFNTNNMQALKPETKKVGVSGTLWWFKDKRNNVRKTKLISAYRGRSGWRGANSFMMSTEELATLWHFPILIQVKAPQLRRVGAKKSEPPANIPFAP